MDTGCDAHNALPPHGSPPERGKAAAPLTSPPDPQYGELTAEHRDASRCHCHCRGWCLQALGACRRGGERLQPPCWGGHQQGPHPAVPGVPYRCRPRRPRGTDGKAPTCCRSSGSEPARAASSSTRRASWWAACGGRTASPGAPRSPACGTARLPPPGTRSCRTPCSTSHGKTPPRAPRSRHGPRRAATPGALRGGGTVGASAWGCPHPPGRVAAARRGDPPEHTTPASSL